VDRKPFSINIHILLSKDNGETWQLQEPAFATIGNDSWNGLYRLKKEKWRH